jgi:hypothetical protein
VYLKSKAAVARHFEPIRSAAPPKCGSFLAEDVISLKKRRRSREDGYQMVAGSRRPIERRMTAGD